MTALTRPYAGVLVATRQMRYQLLIVARSRFGGFTTLAVPVLLLVALNLVTPEMTLQLLGGTPYPDFLTPAMAIFAIVNACYVNVITATVVARESGVLKRLHGTPLPMWAYLSGRLVAAAAVGAVAATVVVVIGIAGFGATLPTARFGAFVAVLLLSVLCLSAVGLAVSGLVRSPDSALPAAYGTMLPLAFVSDLFFPTVTAPAWLRELADWFPLAPLTRAAEQTFIGTGSGFPMSGRDLVTVLVWTAAASAVCMRLFPWQPGDAGLRRLLAGLRPARRGESPW